MADVGVKMGVSGIAQFKKGMTDSQAAVKNLDAALKYNEKQLKASGNAEKDFTTQANLLNAKLKEQKNIVKNAENALKQMEQRGVKTTSAAYQNMQRQMIEAQSAILDTETALRNLGTTSEDVAGQAGKVQDSLSGLNKKVSLGQVQDALKGISGAMESAASKAVDLGKNLLDTIKNSAKAADDAATLAEIYDIPLEKYLQMQALVDSGTMETSVESIITAMQKMKRGVGKESKDTLDTLKELGIGLRDGDILDPYSWTKKDPDKLFWEAGRAVLALGDAYEQEEKAQALFGKSWKDLRPLFDSYETLDDYEAALKGTNINQETTIQNLEELNDKFSTLEHNFQVVKDELIGAIAPALSQVSDIISGVLVEFNKYLQSEEGQKKLKELSDAVVDLFSGLKDIKPGDVIDTAKSIFDGIVTSITWIADHHDEVVTGIKAIIGAFALVEGAKGVNTFMNLINGVRGLSGAGAGAAGAGGAASSAASAGAAAGGAWAAGFANAAWAVGPFAALAALIGWEIYENNKTRDESQEKYQKTAEATEEAAKVTGNTNAAKQVRNLMEGVGYYREADGSFRTGFLGTKQLGFNDLTDETLLAMASMGSMEKAKLFTAINQSSKEGRYTKYGNYTTDELMRYWQSGGQGEDWDKARIDDLARAVGTALMEAETKEASRIQSGGEKTYAEMLAAEWDIWQKYKPEDKPVIPVDPVIENPEEANAAISQAIGTVTVPVEGDPTLMGYPKANGMWSVPFDGYSAILHKGERVMPAREAGNSRNFSSNLYVESMVMNNGTDAEGLAAAMAAAQRRTMSGYGN